MTHLQIIAIEEFAKKLKIDFPVLLRPSNFEERITNIIYEQIHKRIDTVLEEERSEWEKAVKREAEENGK